MRKIERAQFFSSFFFLVLVFILVIFDNGSHDNPKPIPYHDYIFGLSHLLCSTLNNTATFIWTNLLWNVSDSCNTWFPFVLSVNFVEMATWANQPALPAININNTLNGYQLRLYESSKHLTPHKQRFGFCHWCHQIVCLL